MVLVPYHTIPADTSRPRLLYSFVLSSHFPFRNYSRNYHNSYVVMKSRKSINSKRETLCKLCFVFILTVTIISTCIAPVAANEQNVGIKSKFTNWINGEDGRATSSRNNDNNKPHLSIVDISEMRVRDIRRRLTREHGYGADEIALMLDKKELINALAFEEHKAAQKEKDRKKRVAFRRSIIVALICVIFVMFRDLFVHAYEVASVNFVVYTGK